MQTIFKAAVYLIADYNKQIPLLMRHNTGFMDGYWCLIAGRVEPSESIIQAVIRETFEEAKLTITEKDIQLVHTANRYQEAGNGNNNTFHTNWLDFYFYTNSITDHPVNNEPSKHSEIKMFNLEDLPSNLLPYNISAINAYLNHKNYSEYEFTE